MKTSNPNNSSASTAFVNTPFAALTLGSDGAISLNTIAPEAPAAIPAHAPAPVAVALPKTSGRRPQPIVRRQSGRGLFPRPAATTAVTSVTVVAAVKPAATSADKPAVVAVVKAPQVVTIFDTLKQAIVERKSVHGVVKAVVENNGRIYGVRVQLEGTDLLAFAPFSRLGLAITEVHPLLGTTQAFKVIEVDESKGNIVLNRRQAAVQVRLDQLIEQLRVGQVVSGTIRNLADCGAFVEIDGACGLLHVSQLPGGLESVKKGQVVTVKVIRLNKARHQLGLSLA